MNGWIQRLARRGATTIRILPLGGQLTCAQLRQAAEAAMALGVRMVRIGDRQTLTIRLKDPGQIGDCRRLLDAVPWRAEDAPATGSIVSSLPFHGLASHTGWLAERHYHDILAALAGVELPPPVATALIDPQQCWMARHEGTLQFLASPAEDFWRLALRPDWRKDAWMTPFAVHGRAIAETTRALVAAGIGDADWDETRLEKTAAAFLNRGWIEQRDPLPASARRLEPCDGFLRQQDGRLALGLAARDFAFPARFLIDAALLAHDQSLRRIGLSPWRQLIVRDIDGERDAPAWRMLLARHGIAIRRDPPCSFFWRVGSDDADLLALRRELIDELDLRLGPAADLPIALVDGDPIAAAVGPAAIVIRRARGTWGRRRYDLLYREGAAADGEGPLLMHGEGCRRTLLGPLLVKLIDAMLSQPPAAAQNPRQADVSNRETEVAGDARAHCRECLTIHDPEWGDPRSGVEPGTPFEELPADWTCPVCGAPKSAYATGDALATAAGAKGASHEYAA
jgi:rubredoxin